MENYAPVFRIISIVCFSVAGVSLLLALFLFFKFKIISVIGDLTGKTARKSIEKMREANEKSGVKSHGPTPLAKERGPITKPIEDYKLGKDPNETTPISNAGQYSSSSNQNSFGINGTAPITDNTLDATTPIGNVDQYTAQTNGSQYAQGTAPMNAPNTSSAVQQTQPPIAGEGTTPLRPRSGNETALLNEDVHMFPIDEAQKKNNTKKVDMQLLQNIVLVHTDEYI